MAGKLAWRRKTTRAFIFAVRPNELAGARIESDGRADDVHDGINRADFVKMNFARRYAMDFPLRHGDALEHGDRFLLHPGRELAARDQFLDLREIAVGAMRMIVVRVLVFVTVRVGMIMRFLRQPVRRSSALRAVRRV